MSFVSYAQNLEDVMLRRALKDITQGFYIDIGAQDPEADSVSLTFYEKGWRGVHVEPNTAYAEMLRAARPDECVEQVAIGKPDGLLTFYEFPDTGLSTADAAIAMSHQAAGYACKQTQVSVWTCDELLNKHGASRPVHWLKLDVEGFEKQVLETWETSPVRPWILVIESTKPMSQVPMHDEWEALVLEKGYLFAYFDGLNRFYVHESQKERLPAFASPPNIFDEFVALGGAARPFHQFHTDAVKRAETRASQIEAQAEQQIAQAREQIARAEANVARLEASQHAILHSHSWQITAPVRAISSALKTPRHTLLSRAGRLRCYLRWVKFQLQLLRGHGFVSRFAALKRRLQVAASEKGGKPRVLGPVLEKLLHNGKYGEELIAALKSLRKDGKNAISVIIINYNSDELIFQCLSQIAATDFGAGLEVVVVNNDPASEAMNALRAMGDAITLVDNRVNRYFGEANNIGVEYSTGEYLCFVNADAFPERDCIQKLYAAISAGDKRYAAVGPKFFNADGTIQEAGAVMSEDGIPIRFGRGRSADSEEFNAEIAVDYISAACLMVRRDTFCATGGFDLQYEPAYYEDVDLCFKLRAQGEIGFIPQAHVWHLEGGTATNESQREFVKRLGDLNREKFLSTWRSPQDKQWRRWSAPKPGRKAAPGAGLVAVYTPYDLTLGGGERYIFTLLDSLAQKYGLRPVIVTPKPYSKLRLSQLCQSFELESEIDIATLADFAGKQVPELFFALGNHSYPPLDGLGKFNAFICQFPFPGQYEGDTYGDIKTYQDTIVYSSFVKEQLAKNKDFKGTSISVVEPALSWSAADMVSYQAERVTDQVQIIAVGRFFAGGHNKQHGRLIEFFKELYAQHRNIRLHLVGTTMPHKEHMAYLESLRTAATGLPIEFHVNAEPDRLKKLYGQCHIYWHGTGMGVDAAVTPERLEHFGISVIEAMAFGCVPVVHKSGGPLFIMGTALADLAYADQPEFIEINRRLIANPEALPDLGAKARSRAFEFDREHFIAKLASVVEK